MSIQRMKALNFREKRVLIREDLNVPIKDGAITSDARIRAALPTIQLALQANAKVILMSHLGRPTEGEYDEQFSMKPVADHLSSLLNTDVAIIKDWQQGFDINNGQVVLLENVRFNKGEKKNDDNLAKAYAALCDVFVMDAFGTAHRAQASTHGVAKFAPIACAGPLLSAELDALETALAEPAKPMLAIVGGSKVSTKLEVLEALSEKVDQLIVGGGIANTFLAATGAEVGKSLCEHDLIPTAKKLLEKVTIPMPVDVVVAKEFAENAEAITKDVADIESDDMILDIGPKTAAQFAEIIQNAKTIIWNGPVGVFEFPAFSGGTKAVSEAVATSAGFSIAGGGDTLAAIDQFGISDKVSYISTGGGAFLEYVEGKTLPAVAVLESK